MRNDIPPPPWRLYTYRIELRIQILLSFPLQIFKQI